MSKTLAVIMDPIEKINFHKDGTLGLLLAASQAGYDLFYLQQGDLFLKDGVTFGNGRSLQVYDNPQKWFELQETQTQALHQFTVVLMRKDPPFDTEYIFTTYLLELAQQKGVKIVNNPQALRDCNEKMFINWFPQCCPPTVVTRSKKQILEFLQEQQEIVVKPLNAMGGASIFTIKQTDRNQNVIIETITAQETCFVMAQKFIPEVLTQGDKRIFILNGEAMPYALLRKPAANDFRGNLVAGAEGQVVELTEKDRWICAQLAPTLRDKGLYFVGIDVLGDYLTEINVTSPTGFRQIKKAKDFDIAGKFVEHLL